MILIIILREELHMMSTDLNQYDARILPCWFIEKTNLSILISNSDYFYRWMGADQDKTNKNLPPDKQFLVTRGVPCEKRIADLQKYHEDNAQELEVDAEDGWVETINPE